MKTRFAAQAISKNVTEARFESGLHNKLPSPWCVCAN